VSKIFISHSSANNAAGLALAAWLDRNGWGEHFLDVSVARGLSPGERWQEALKAAADRCQVVVFVISPAWRDSRWCLAEFLLAKQLGKTSFGVLVEATPLETLPSEMTAEWQLCDLVAGAERESFRVALDPVVPETEVSFATTGLERLRLGLQKAGLDPSTFLWPPPGDPERAPYRGLRALDEADAAVFFGRDADVVRGLDELRGMRERGVKRMLVILGASGAGKSSFLRAGLLPRLKRDDRHFLPLPIIRPERAVLSGTSGLAASLELAFRGLKAPVSRGEMRRRLAEPQGLDTLLGELQELGRARLEPGASPPTVVIPIDQGEELFGARDRAEGGAEAEAFVSSLAGVLAEPSDRGAEAIAARQRALAIVSIRAESYGSLQTEPRLERVKPQLYPLNPIPRGEFKAVIEGPAARATAAGRKLTLEPVLTEQLLRDAEGADALPLLGFTLERLFLEYGGDGDLRLDEYDKLGGVRGSITAAIEHAFAEPGREPAVPPDRAERERRLRLAFVPWLALVDPDTGERKRRVARWNEIPEPARPLIDRLVAARLLVQDRPIQAGGGEDTVVEIAHEALLRQWSALDGWLAEDAGELQRLEAARRAAAEWQKNGRAPAWLVHAGERLAAAEALQRRPAFDHLLGEQGRAYLSGCRAVERRRLQREARSARWLRSLVVGLGVALVFALLVGWEALRQKGAAEREARGARAAQSGQIASLALSSLRLAGTSFEALPQRSLLLAVQALRITEDRHEPSVPAAREALRRVLASTGGRSFGGHDSAVLAVDLSRNGRWMVTASENGSSARLWDLETKDAATQVRELPGAGGPVAIRDDSRFLVTAGRGKEPARLWDLTSPTPTATARVLDEAAGPFAFSRDNRWLVTGGADRSVRLWDLASRLASAPTVLPPQENRQIVIAVSPDSRWLVTSGWNPDNEYEMDVTRLWDLAAPHPETTGLELKGHTASVSNIVFSPDSRWLATSSAVRRSHNAHSDEHVRLWDLTKIPASAIELAGHEGPITAMAISRDGRWLVTGSADRTARVWKLTGDAIGATSVVLPGHDGAVIGAVIAPQRDSGPMIVTIDEVKNPGSSIRHALARVWKLETESQASLPAVVSHNDRAISVSLFTPSDDGRRLLLASGRTAFVLDLDLVAHSPTSPPIALYAHEGDITTAAFARDGASVATGAADRTAHLWRLHPVRPSAQPTVLLTDDTRFAMSPDNRQLVTIGSASPDGPPSQVAVLWDLTSPDMATRSVLLRGHTQPIVDLAVSHDGRWLATGSEDATARLWDLRASDPSAASIVMAGHGGPVTPIVFSRDGRWLVTGSSDPTVRLWDLSRKNPSEAPRVLRAAGSASQLAISTDSRWLAVHATSGSTLLDLKATDPARTSMVLKDADSRVLLSPDGRWLITYGSDEEVTLRGQIGAARDGREIRDLEQKLLQIVPIAAVLDLTAKDPVSMRRVLANTGEPLGASRDGRWLVTQGQAKVPLLWELTRQGPAPAPMALKEQTEPLAASAFSADGRWLVTGGYDGSTRLWDLSAADVGASSQLLSHHPISVGTVAISPDARWILEASKNLPATENLAYLWEAGEDGRFAQRIELSIGAADISRAAFSTDGKWLVTSSYDTRTISVWSLELDDLMRLACRTAGRDLTPTEREQYFPGQAPKTVCPDLGDR
jgi:WD40 repeat protein